MILADRRTLPAGLAFGRWTAPDGWRLRRFDWPGRGTRGSLLFLGGRGDFIEKYLEPLAHWHDRGWGLAGFDWRGQGGSGRLLADRTICHLASFDPLLEDLAAFVRDWRAESPGPHVAVANSMGGQLLLRLLDRDPAAFDAGVLTAPMLGIAVKGLPTPVIHRAARLAVAMGRSEQRIWRRDIGDVGGRMTSCPDRQADKVWWKAEYPEIASGGPSWGWTRAACASIAALRPADLARITTPLQVFAARRDAVLDIRAVRSAVAALPDATLTLLPGHGHELLREVDAIRLPIMARIDQFLDDRAPLSVRMRV